MITLIRTNSDNQDFRELVKQLNADLAIRDGSELPEQLVLTQFRQANHTY